MLLAGKRILVTGVLTRYSIAFSVARLAQQEGAEIVLTSFPDAMRATERAARKLDPVPPILEFDARHPDAASRLRTRLEDLSAPLDGVLHAIAAAGPHCIGEDFTRACWGDVGPTIQVSAYSLKALADATAPLMAPGRGSIVGLDFDARQAWPYYDWMGVAKAALEAIARYLARDLGPRGIRINLVCAGPLLTAATARFSGLREIGRVWDERAPLGWSTRDAEPVARACVLLLSDWLPATTGEMVHVDGGFHCVATSAQDTEAPGSVAEAIPGSSPEQ